MGEGGFVQRTGKTGERGRGRLDPAWGKREEGERRGILILHPATHTRIKLSYQNFLNPHPLWHDDNYAEYAKHGQICIFGAHFSWPNMVKWGLPEKILQNAVQAHWS